jgi:hypothetical protein
MLLHNKYIKMIKTNATLTIYQIIEKYSNLYLRKDPMPGLFRANKSTPII